MFTRPSIALLASVLAIVGLAMGSILIGQQREKPAAGHEMPMPGAARGSMPHDHMKMTKAEKIANALTAGPSTVSTSATVLDWPSKEGAAPEVLRAGTNGWTCFPDMAETNGNDPMCLDEPWMKWIEAYLAHKKPDVRRLGIGYMMAPGGAWGSNSDPYAMKKTGDNHWGHHQPHVMIVVPDTKSLAGISTDPHNGGPYVMWAGTPYAHIMAPTSAAH